jgi:hypothetical protein
MTGLHGLLQLGEIAGLKLDADRCSRSLARDESTETQKARAASPAPKNNLK